MQERIRPQISITVNQGILDEVDRLSEKIGISRSQLINNILTMGVGDVKILEKVGLIDLAAIIRKFQGRVSRELRAA